jgi:hypothetical protein
MAAGFAACDSGGSDGGGGNGPIQLGAGTGNATAGAGNAPNAGAGSPGSGGGTAAGAGAPSDLPAGVPLTPSAGWVAKDNEAGIQGAVFSFGDPTSKMGMMENFTLGNACISGTAAKVDMASTACTTKMFTAPATDCYGEYWGAAIGMNLNQSIDTTLTPPAGGTPAPYDASSLKGFAFVVSGNTVPAPSAFRFKVEDGTTEFCNPATIKIKVGTNIVMFSDLISQCWMTSTPPAPNAETVKSHLIKISWQVVTNASSTVPFDFCISDVRALVKDGVTLPPVGTGSAGAGGAPAAAGAGGAPAGGAPAGGAPAGGTGGAAAGGAGGASAGAGGAKAGSGGTAG